MVSHSVILLAVLASIATASSESIREAVQLSLQAPVVDGICNCSASCRASGDPHVIPFGYSGAVTVRPPSGTILTMYKMDLFDTQIDIMAEGNAKIPTGAWVSEVYTVINNVKTTVANVDDCASNGQYLYTNTFTQVDLTEDITQQLDVAVQCVYASGINLRDKHYRLDLFLSKNDDNVGYDNFFDFELGGNGDGECFGSKTGTTNPGNTVCVCEKQVPTLAPTLPFIPCSCDAECKMLNDPIVHNFNQVSQNYYGDEQWHTVYEYDIFLVLAYFVNGLQPQNAGKEWVQNVTINDVLYDVSMCWNDWTVGAPNNCATRNSNARYKFPTVIIPSSNGDATLTVDVHCVCRSRIDVPLNTRLDVWVKVHDGNVPVAANPANNDFLEAQIDAGANGMCFPGYGQGVLDPLKNSKGPKCTCPF